MFSNLRDLRVCSSRAALSGGLEKMPQSAALTTHLAIARAAPESLEQGAPRTGSKPLWELFQAGQLLELSGRAAGKLSAAARLIARAQAEGEPVAWVGLREEAGFYPPD